MDKKITSSIIICLLSIGGFIGFVNFSSQNARGLTYVSGSINTDTTWDLAGSPYIIIGDVIVESGVTLTIDPGVEVKFDDYLSIFIKGTLKAIGTETDRIIMTSNKIKPISIDWRNIQTNSTGHAEIRYCHISNAYAAISLISSNNNITNNNLWNNNWGIEIWGSSNNNITGNVFNMNDAPSIISNPSSSNNIIAYNNLSNSDWGIYLWESSNETIINNNLSNNGRGIYLRNSINITIAHNNFINDGVFIDGYTLAHYNSHHIPDDNIINGKPLLYYRDCNGIYIDGIPVGQVILANCTDVQVRNLKIDSVDRGLQVAYSTDIIIANNNFSWNDFHGIRLYESSNNAIIDNNVSHNLDGIALLESSDNNIITNNNITWNNHTSAWALIVFNSSDNSIADNYIRDNWIGIGLSTSSMNNTAAGNYISNNENGLGIGWGSSYNLIKENIISSTTTNSLVIWESSNKNIINNNTILNGDYGLIVGSSSDDNIITGNIITDNNYGCYVEDSSNNTLANNNVSKNKNGIDIHGNSDNNVVVSNTILLNNISGIRINGRTNNNISVNTISGNYKGLNIYQFSDGNTFKGNTVSDNDYGIYVGWTIFHNLIYHNNIINNTLQAYDETDNTTQWDNGYPGGGNYWSDFDEPGEGAYDDFNGPDQLSLGSDGIVDNGTMGGGGKNPYVIDPDSQDNYPLMDPVINSMYLFEGWNLISVPLIQSDTNIGTVLSSISGSYDAVQYYDVTDTTDHWKHNHTSKPEKLNDLDDIEHTMGFWIHITKPGGVVFEYPGIKPMVNQSIPLHVGWNLVGYPSLSNKPRDTALNNIIFGTDVDAIQTYDAATGTWEVLGPSDEFEIARGYWVHSKVDTVWDVPL